MKNEKSKPVIYDLNIVKVLIYKKMNEHCILVMQNNKLLLVIPFSDEWLWINTCLTLSDLFGPSELIIAHLVFSHLLSGLFFINAKVQNSKVTTYTCVMWLKYCR